MKIFTLFCFFLPVSLFAQQPDFRGCYNRDRVAYDDTSGYIYLNRDSVKEMLYVQPPNGKRISMNIKCGKWYITGLDTGYHEYSVMLKFNDGTCQIASFNPTYLEIPLDMSTEPFDYQLTINYVGFKRYFGTNGYFTNMMEKK